MSEVTGGGKRLSKALGLHEHNWSTSTHVKEVIDLVCPTLLVPICLIYALIRELESFFGLNGSFSVVPLFSSFSNAHCTCSPIFCSVRCAYHIFHVSNVVSDLV